MNVTNKHITPSYTWGDDCHGWRLMDDDALAVVEEEMPAGTAETLHLHEKASQVFYVLDGRLTIIADKTRHALGARDALHIHPHTIHEVRNETCEVARFLVISTPSTANDRINLQPSDS